MFKTLYYSPKSSDVILIVIVQYAFLTVALLCETISGNISKVREHKCARHLAGMKAVGVLGCPQSSL